MTTANWKTNRVQKYRLVSAVCVCAYRERREDCGSEVSSPLASADAHKTNTSLKNNFSLHEMYSL